MDAPRHLAPARILIVDDQKPNVSLLEQMLRKAGFENVRSTTDSRETLSIFKEFHPDLILLDLLMPHLDGVGVMKELRPHAAAHSHPPILILTADTTPEAKLRALSAGAKDFLTKPFDRTEVLLRIGNLLQTRLLQRQLESINDRLEQDVAKRTAQLEISRNEVLERLAIAAEHRDDDTGNHIQRVGEISGQVARVLGLSPDEAELIRRAATLHDVGKIGIPDDILLKPGKFTPSEREQMQTHSLIGARILSGSDSPLLRMAEEIALNHHERWDGSGYPRGLRGAEIPRSARIVAVVDVFDALTHHRPYKAAWPMDEAIAELRRQRNMQFEPEVVDAFIEVHAELKVELLEGHAAHG